MGIQDGQYKSFAMLTERVIEKAQGQINERTDLEFEYQVDRIGRRPQSLLFTMELKKKGILVNPNADAVAKKLAAFGIQNHQIDTLLKTHDLQYLLANIAIVEKRLSDGKQIKNVPAYLMAAFENDYRPLETEYTKAQKAKAKEEQAHQAKVHKEALAITELE